MVSHHMDFVAIALSTKRKSNAIRTTGLRCMYVNLPGLYEAMVLLPLDIKLEEAVGSSAADRDTEHQVRSAARLNENV